MRLRPARLLGAVLLAAARCCTRRARSPTCSAATATGCSSSAAAGPRASRPSRSRRPPREGDPAALDCFEEIGRWLGQGLADLAAVLDPGVFVIGGGVADAGELLLGPGPAGLRRAADRRRLAARTPRSGWPSSGNDAGLVGAADLARSPLSRAVRLVSEMVLSGHGASGALVRHSRLHDLAPPPPPTRTVTTAACCRRPMSSIEVTTRGATLVLHSCTACGRHLWERTARSPTAPSCSTA